MRLLKILLLLSIAIAAPAVAQPGKLMRIVVPFPPGGGVDVVARKLGEALAKQLDQQVIVENKPGASGNIGADAVQKSAADGATLLVSASTFIVNPLVAAQKAPFDPMKDFTHLALIAKGPVLLITHPSYGATLREFIDGARAHPEKYNLATGGYGSAGHLAGESFKLRAGLKIPVVLYKGTAPAFADLMGGQISGLFDPLVTSLPLAKGGKVLGLALAAPKRSPLAPDIPTMAEAGMPGFEFYTWYGLWGPADIPQAAASRIESAVAAAGKSPELSKWFESQGLEYGNLTGKSFVGFERQEQATVEDIVRRGNLKPQ
ncbi:MAG: tripartite tricarboxylate transporter substrate binding protein [Betaproteobacteria bacterium]|nr:MAG: tripartite tricarboxylate transporter substrate binding protein [Betaproteobacteria bacterium]